MKYVQPFGEVANAPYVNANPATGTRGSVVPAEAIEHVMREIVEVILHANLTPDGNDLTQLRQAIQSLIQAALGGGEPGDYVTAAQLGSLPIYPEILSADGRMNPTAPAAGTILVPPGVSFRFNGFFTYSTSDNSEAERLFTTLANKVYHLRRRRAAAVFELLDLSNAGYNPGGAAETDPAFDSTFDDMLVARIVTNGANVATITPLANKPFGQLKLRTQLSGGFGTRVSSNPNSFLIHPFTGANGVTLNWARTPEVGGAANRGAMVGTLQAIPDGPFVLWTGNHSDGTGSATASRDRYSLQPVVRWDMNAIATAFDFSTNLFLVADA